MNLWCGALTSTKLISRVHFPPHDRLIGMTDPLSESTSAGDLRSAPQATLVEETPHIEAVASVASDADPLARVLDYTLTVGQARQRFLDCKRHVPAERTIQNYCVQGDIVAQKIRTTYGAEWIINAASLETFILRQPELMSVASDAQTTIIAAHATQAVEPVIVSATASPSASDAGDAMKNSEGRPAGEHRSLVDVLIENARLLAQVEDRNEVVADLKRERSFMQDQVRSAVKLSERALTQGDNLLRTLQVMRLGPGVVMNDNQTSNSNDAQSAPVDNPTVPHRDSGL